MNTLDAALADVTGVLDDLHVPYMVIGGYANLCWGRPRLTADLDLKIDVPEPEWPEFLERLRASFKVLPQDPLGFARETMVIPLETSVGVRVDLMLAGLPFEREAIRHARTVELAGRPLRICTPEDLILQKILSERARDREDIEGVFARTGPDLDRDYLERHVREIASALERPEILDFYVTCLRESGLPARADSTEPGTEDQHG